MAITVQDIKEIMSASTFKPVDIHKVNYTFVPSYNLRNCVAREPSMMDKFYCSETTDNNGEKSFHMGDDLHLLLNRKFMSHVNPSTIADWVATLRPSSADPINKALSKMTDEQLSSFVKSRHIQAPCELLSWSGYLQSLTEDIEGKVKNVYNDIHEQIEAEKAELAAKAETPPASQTPTE